MSPSSSAEAMPYDLVPMRLTRSWDTSYELCCCRIHRYSSAMAWTTVLLGERCCAVAASLCSHFFSFSLELEVGASFGSSCSVGIAIGEVRCCGDSTSVTTDDAVAVVAADVSAFIGDCIIDDDECGNNVGDICWC